jgi:hypothetical protein
VGAPPQRAHEVVGGRETGEEDHRRGRRAVLGQQPVEHLPAVEHGHLDVEQHHVDVLAAHDLERRRAVGRLEHPVARRLELDPHQQADGRAVVGDQHRRAAPGRRHGSGRALRGGAVRSEDHSARPYGAAVAGRLVPGVPGSLVGVLVLRARTTTTQPIPRPGPGGAVLALVALHLALALVAPALGARIGRRVFLVVALAPLATAVWAATRYSGVVAGDDVVSTTPWVPGLDLTLDLRLDPLGLLLVTLVAGVGTLVFVYCARYFSRDRARRRPLRRRPHRVRRGHARPGPGRRRAAALRVLGAHERHLVPAHRLQRREGGEPPGGRAGAAGHHARRAGDAGGLILLSLEAGTTSLSGILAAPPAGTTTSVALVLVLVGAFTKSAQVPFHPWLAAAMAAPTPVSAYLHAAAMVKAGVYLVARFAPSFAEAAPWRPLVVTVGVVTMSRRRLPRAAPDRPQAAAAFGTVSQLASCSCWSARARATPRWPEQRCCSRTACSRPACS